MAENITNRYDFTLIFDVKDGNPNGDPDAGNLPRIDPENGQGLITDVCLKRKVRNYVLMAREEMTKDDKEKYDIFVKEKAILNNLIQKGYDDAGIVPVKQEKTDDGKKKAKETKGKGDEVEKARQQMCKTYFDIRTFGAVMTTGANAGQVRGPVQFTFARSVEPVSPLEHSITRCAVTKPEDSEKQSGDNRTMGRKNTISYGLYVAHGFISPHLAAQTKFNSDDLELLWTALENMFEVDHSAARGMMSTCKLIVFKHDSALGNATSKSLFDRVKISRSEKGSNPPRSFDDYVVTINKDNLPSGVEIIERL